MKRWKKVLEGNNDIIQDDDVREYFYQEYAKSNIKVTPGHWPNFKSRKEVDEWINHLQKLESMFDTLFDDKDNCDKDIEDI